MAGPGGASTHVRIGIVSDTHGLLRPELFTAFEGIEHIVHAGDIGDLELLVELRAIAPVTAVWGNTDGMEVRAALPERAVVEFGGVRIGIMHGHQLGSPDPRRVAAALPDSDLVVFGHTHQPVIERVGSVTAVNPGSAGRARFRLPVTAAIADIEAGSDRRLDADPGTPTKRPAPRVRLVELVPRPT